MRFILCIFLILTSSFAAGEEAEPNWFARLVIGTRFAGPIIIHCVRAVGCSTLVDLNECRKNYPLLMDATDGSTLRTFGIDQFFGKYLKTIAKDPMLPRYLSHLQTLLDSGVRFNLWSVTLKSPGIKGDKKKAIALLGALFHDVYYQSEILPPEIQAQKIAVLKKLIPAVEKQSIDGYPPGVETGKDEGGIYHFYSIALLTQDMHDKGAPKRYAAALAYGLNEYYVSRRASQTKRLPQVGEIYVAYAGAQFALTGDTEKFTGQPLEEFKKSWNIKGTVAAADAFAEGFGGKKPFCTDEVSAQSFFSKPLPQPNSEESPAATSR